MLGSGATLMDLEPTLGTLGARQECPKKGEKPPHTAFYSRIGSPVCF